MAEKDKPHPLPSEGGSWLRDPVTGELTRPPEEPEVPEKAPATTRKTKEK